MASELALAVEWKDGATFEEMQAVEPYIKAFLDSVEAQPFPDVIERFTIKRVIHR